ncbi:MAG: hypothetical protein Q4B15_02315 [Lachnospiraceae bacterium]|nr:hypothetical protein [Lachnospiraceae bacterium]
MAKQNTPLTEKQKKRKKRADAFWRALLFTKDGKPKSSLMIYSFCLSIVFVVFYISAMYFLIDWMYELVSGLPAVAGNLIQSLIVLAAGTAIAFLLNRIFKDKRIMLATYLWMVGYMIAVFVIAAIIMASSGEILMLLQFYVWFLIIPVLPTFLALYFYYRKTNPSAAKAAEAEPEWKKYINRQ